MKNINDELLEFNFLSLCESIEYPNENTVVFSPIQGFYDNRDKEIYKITIINNSLVITDNGITYSNLDHIFEINEPDVIRNIIAILRQTKIKWVGKEFVCNLDCNEKLCPQIIAYLQGINFIYAMKLFYV